MKARLLVSLLFGALLCNCYRHTKTEPSSVQIESPFEECSFSTGWLPANLLISIKDAKQPMLDIMPDLPTAVLTSSKGVRYPVRFFPSQMFYNGASSLNEREEAKKVKSPKVGYQFSVMRSDLPDQQLDCLPAGSFTFSVTFTGPTGANNVSIAFKRSTHLESYQIGH